MHPTREKSPAQKIGSFMAVIQSHIDDLFTFLFKKLKRVGKETSHINNPESLGEHASQAVHVSASFLGELGESYYKTYNKMKVKKAREAEPK